jgi:polysaccharide export outer membrane protein
MVTHPRVTVQVKESRIHSIAIMGAVKRPQIYPLFGSATLLDALSEAEGLAQDAGNTAIVTRGETAVRRLESEQGGQVKPGAQEAVSRKITVDLRRLLEDGDTSLNLDLYPGDRVMVQRAGIVYVTGAVNRAGGFVLKDDGQQMTVLKAIALAESLKSTAMPGKTMIIRRNPQAPGASEEIPVDLKKILSGHLPDRPLLASDILFVPDSNTKKALHRAGEAAAQAAALFIYRVP